MRSFVVAPFLLGANCFVASFTSTLVTHESRCVRDAVSKNSAFVSSLAMSAPTDTAAEKESFIDTELRAAAMKLHTRVQAPREGQAEEKVQKEPYVTTHDDYMAFLVDSQHVYQAIEDVIGTTEAFVVFRDSPLDRVKALDTDIAFMEKEYSIKKPDVGKPGQDYANVIRQLGTDGGIAEILCHYYNFYFAHTAGGRMIGKQMSSLLLDKKTLEFYKWDGNINKIKDRVKGEIEDMVVNWSPEERKRCTDQTAAAFKGGGSLNSYLAGGQSPH